MSFDTYVTQYGTGIEAFRVHRLSIALWRIYGWPKVGHVYPATYEI